MDKKAFSLMEIVISIAILSFVMVTLLQIKSENIFLLSKSDEMAINNEFLLIAMNLDDVNKRNENVFLDRKFSFQNDEIRKQLKRQKIKMKDNKIDSFSINNKQSDLNIDIYETQYSLSNDIQKKIYSFKIEL